MPAFDDKDFAVNPAPASQQELDRMKSSEIATSEGVGGYGRGQSENFGAIEVPATRSSIADASPYMHQLSLSPSQRDRRGSRNSFGAALPIPRSKRQSRLSSVTHADGRPQRPGMPPIQPTRELLAGQVQDMSQTKVKAAKDMAFVFDIDGVLVHGDRLIPEGQRTLEILNGDNELGIKIPHIFLTNGSGKPEQARVDQLSKILHQPISTEQFIQSHTPMSALAEYYNTVLVVGGEGYRCREVAEQYGFKDIVVPNDIVAWDPTIAPYRVFTDAERATSRPRDFSKTNIDAIMCFSDSRDYATDIQIIMDLLQSENGRLHTRAKDPVSQRIPIYFSQGDLLCPTEHPYPRMSQGAFRIGIEAMYKALTGEDLERVVYGKPELATYKYADEVIASWMEKIHNEEKLPKNIYMVGDNPASDIIGGNMYGWNTCLVRTGVFQGGDNDENNPANFGVFTNVLEAVKTAIKKEIGEDFNFKWDDEKVNPLLQGDTAASAVAIE
ncbi:putative CDP-alcohol phosphatidyltransferase class-I family protein C22A12.08c [Pseudocercospora fuligena]|uniref:Putative CDP-alcohol phosphatidyltransferase class-I family protein C22A12.08c n=1 Tax=Pseudocercospora fuligena TaxID=685502 RepID=A0A8H6RUF5_9PEZI|nr:putative CDP-alcohol phosphatidyltransferase class-I family protein C22A12.08c [Pseudocercospora fuligena]